MNAVVQPLKVRPSTIAMVMAYEHPGLVERLQEKMLLSEDEAKTLFQDTKLFLFLCSISKKPLAPSAQIDECWHNFILFTKDYDRFCNEHFNTFIHHRPKTLAERASSDGTIVKETVAIARDVFGDNVLTQNWSYRRNGTGESPICDDNIDNCQGSTNCQSSTSDPPDK